MEICRLADLTIPEGLVQAVQGEELYFFGYSVGISVYEFTEDQISCIYKRQNSLAIYVDLIVRRSNR